GGEKAVLRLHRSLEILVLLLQCLLDPFALADISNRTGYQRPVLRLERAETDLHRELRAVPTQPEELEAGTHRAHSRIGEEPGAVLRMLAAEALGQHHLDLFPQELRARVAEELLGLRIHQDDVAVAVHDDDGVWGGFQQPLEFLLRFLALADVADRAR